MPALQTSHAVPKGWELKATSGIPSRSTMVPILLVWDHWSPMPIAISPVLISAARYITCSTDLIFHIRLSNSGWVSERAEDHTECQHEIQSGSLVIVACLLLKHGRSPWLYFTKTAFLLFSAALWLIPAEVLEPTRPHTPDTRLTSISQAGPAEWPTMTLAPPLQELWASPRSPQNLGQYKCMRDGQKRVTQRETKRSD